MQLPYTEAQGGQSSSTAQTLPPIRMVFADQNLFRQSHPANHGSMPNISASGIGSAIRQLDFASSHAGADRDRPMDRATLLQAHLESLRLSRSTSIVSSATSDDSPSPTLGKRRALSDDTATGGRVTKKRAANAQSKHSQKIRNRKGRRWENAGFRFLESVTDEMILAAKVGNRQIVSNQQKSGLKYTKCSILEMATRLLLICKPLLERCREQDPRLSSMLEEVVDQVMEEKLREEQEEVERGVEEGIEGEMDG